MRNTLISRTVSALSLLFVALFVLLLCTGSPATSAPAPYSHFFSQRCSSCHSDDAPTCDGCHEHGNYRLTATPDKSSYAPGEEVTVTFSGGEFYGWIRSSLERTDGTEVDRNTGPTFSGNDGGSQIEFPVKLTGRAPGTPGNHTWRVKYYGSNNSGTNHSTATKSVTVSVTYSAQVTCNIVPQFTPMTFGKNGGTVYCDVTLENRSGAQRAFDVLLMVRMPGGNLVGPVFGPLHLVLPASYPVTAPFSIVLPSTAPEGTYSLEVYTADLGQGKMLDSDSFAFVKGR